MRRVKVSVDVYVRLKEKAEEKGISIPDYVSSLLAPLFEKADK